MRAQAHRYNSRLNKERLQTHASTSHGGGHGKTIRSGENESKSSQDRYYTSLIIDASSEQGLSSKSKAMLGVWWVYGMSIS